MGLAAALHESMQQQQPKKIPPDQSSLTRNILDRQGHKNNDAKS